MKRLILLDAHAILHRAYHGIPDFSTSKGEPTGALYGLSTMLIKIIEDLKPDYIVACYDLKGPTYRHEIYKEYKAGRQKTDDDLIAQIIRSTEVFDALNIPIYSKEGFEADDIIGTIVQKIHDSKIKNQKKDAVIPTQVGIQDHGRKIHDNEADMEIIIASGDMDTMQLIDGTNVKVYTLKKGISDTIMYDEDAIMKRFGFAPQLIADYKGLRGDPSDNIPGIKGIGEKSGTALITTFGTIENMYKELEKGNEKAFTEAGMTPRLIGLIKDNKEEAEFSKMLATIRRDAPIDFVLPPKTFKDHLDLHKVGAFWQSLEFRGMLPRLEKAIGNGVSTQKANWTSGTIEHSEVEQSSAVGRGERSSHGFAIAKSSENPPLPINDGLINRLELQKTTIALWLVASHLTNPTIDDIYDFANTKNFSEASRIIFTELDKRGLRKVYENIELPLIPIIKKMETRGVKIDKKLLAELSKKYHTTLTELEKNIWREAGMEFNIASPKQLGEVLFDKLGLKIKNAKKTDGGARSTRESELEKMRDMHTIIPFIFEYREISKLLGTYIDAIPPLLDKENRLHTHFIQTGAATGRMASQDPGLQNIPIKTELGKNIRYAFIAEKGFKLVSLDYSQMELRIAAFMSGDEKLIQIFREGQDVHTAVAASVFKVDQKDVTSEMRRRAKVINFGIIYGMGVLALKQNLGSTREEAHTYLNDYFSTFSTLAMYLDRVKADAARTGFTETFYGRRRYFEGIKSKIPYVRAAAERMAINAPIQGTGADVIKLAMTKIDEYITKNKLQDDVYLLLQVHDELVCEIREGKAEQISKEITHIMESVMDPKDTQGVVLTAHAAIGDSWGELK